MNTENVVYRLLQSMSSSKDMLQSFGITTTDRPIEELYPPIFLDKYKQDWVDFSRSVNKSVEPFERRLVYTVLDFIRYLKSLNINPFSVPFKTSPSKLYQQIFTDTLIETSKDISKFLRSRAFYNFKIKKSTIKSNPKLVSYYCSLVPAKRIPIDVVIKSLQGKLYYLSKVPIQFKFDKRSPKWNQCISDTNSYGWYVLVSNNSYNIAIRRSQDTLILRVLIPIDNSRLLPSKIRTLSSKFKVNL